MKQNKKKVIFISIGILVAIGIIVGTSYAWWTYTATQTSDNTIHSDCLKLNIVDETNAISLEKAYPITDEEASRLTPYKFTIQNVCNTSITYDVNLEVMDSENRLLSEYIALDFNKQGKRILNVYPSTTPSIGIESYGLASGSLKGKESISYELSLWMDEHVTAEDDAMNKSFTSKVVVNASLNQVVELYKEEILNGADPVLKDNLIPVEIGNDGRVTKANTQNEWYNYQNKKWANAVILEDESITYQDYEEIPEDNIESYFVWIPKYSYQLWDLGEYNSLTTIDESKVHEIPIKFGLENTSDSIEGECTTPMNEEKTQGLSGESGNCKIGDYMTQPAFISMNTNGLWVGKFETGYKGAKTTNEAEINNNEPEKVEIKPNVYSWRNISVGNAFHTSYNYKRELDSHMMKNTEWGAVAYLQYSAYGSASKVRINNNSAFITGYAAINEPTLGDTPISIPENRYELTSPKNDGTYTLNYLNNESVKASTTGNYTGIYDMSGGAWESVMGYNQNSTITDESGFTSIDNNFNINTLLKKYYDSYFAIEMTDNFKRILGDATGELGPFEGVFDPDEVIRNRSSWYNDYGVFIYEIFPWFARGAFWRDGTGAGNFALSGHYTGATNLAHAFRIVLAI